MSQGLYESAWTLLDENGGSAVTFTSFFDIDYRNEGQALSYPIELGGFANYNKVQSPIDIKVTLGIQGDDSDLDYALLRLEMFQEDAVKLTIVTPTAVYGGMTLEAFSYKRSRENNAGMLVVELALVEVREVETQVTTTVITKPKNPTSSDKINTGKTQPESNSVLYDITN